MEMTAVRRFDELCTAAERMGLRVLLHAEGKGARTRLSRIVVDDPRKRREEDERYGYEVVGLKIGPKGLEHAALACLRYLKRVSAR